MAPRQSRLSDFESTTLKPFQQAPRLFQALHRSDERRSCHGKTGPPKGLGRRPSEMFQEHSDVTPTPRGILRERALRDLHQVDESSPRLCVVAATPHSVCSLGIYPSRDKSTRIKSMSVVVDQLLERARNGTGLSDFGPGDWQDGLRRLVEAVQADVDRDSGFIDRIEAIQVARLCRRLRVEEWYARHAAEAQEAVEGPFVIFGLPRTGTTALHYLLSLDSRFRYLRKWEVEEPIPPPDVATEGSDVRRQQESSQSDSQHIRRIDGPVEDSAIFEMCFHHSELVLPVPSYTAWWRSADHRDAFAYHERILRLLHSHRPPHRWLLKFPNYIFLLPELAAKYPEARFVMTHRDPVTSVSSTCSVVLASRKRRLPDATFDPHSIGPEILEHFVDGIHRTLVARTALGEHRFVDVRQRELEADPVGIAERVYDHAGLDLDEPARKTLSQWAAANQSGSRGEHSYQPEDFGLTAHQIRQAFAEYLDAFPSLAR